MPKIVSVGLGVALLLAAPTYAQLTPTLPGVGAPSLPVSVPDALPRLGGPLERGRAEMRVTRQAHIRVLIRNHRALIEADPRGEPILRGELVGMVSAPAALAALQAAGFTIRGQVLLAGLDMPVSQIGAPAGVSTRRALRALRRLDPMGVYDFNHIYMQGGDAGAARFPAGAEPSTGQSAALVTAPLRIGLVDGGVDASHPAFAAASIRRGGCEDHVVPTDHGTAVASLLVGHTAGFSGVAPTATLFAADVYCGAPTGGNVVALAGAFAWLAAEGVRVINVSLVGAPNAALERIIARLQASGHVIVAAVGNDGPAAPLLYPAAYPGVVGVTGVDRRQRVLLEACRGPHVAFAAPGADMVAASGGSFASVRGTSFAAPIVAALLALELDMDPGPAEAAVARLTATATDLGRSGRDPIYGAGLVGDRFRMDPKRVATLDPR